MQAQQSLVQQNAFSGNNTAIENPNSSAANEMAMF